MDYNDLRRKKFQMHGMKDYDRLSRWSRAATASPRWHAARCPPMCATRSNGERIGRAQERIRENALYLLDEPENSFHPSGSWSWHSFLHDSARFYNCQFVIATHSPFLLGDAGGADLRFDSEPIATKRWTELEKRAGNVGVFPEPQR